MFDKNCQKQINLQTRIRVCRVEVWSKLNKACMHAYSGHYVEYEVHVLSTAIWFIKILKYEANSLLKWIPLEIFRKYNDFMATQDVIVLAKTIQADKKGSFHRHTITFKINHSVYNIHMYRTNFWPLVVHLQQDIF